MPTNAEIHAAIDLLIRQPNSHILTNAIADMLDDMVDNIAAGGGGVPTLTQVLTENNDGGGQSIRNIADPDFDQDAATKTYVDQSLETLSSGITLDSILDGDPGLSAPRVIDVAGNDLRVNNGVDEVIFIDVSGTEIVVGYKKGPHFGHHRAAADDFGGDFNSRADFDNGTKFAEIIGNAIASGSSLQYSAERHTFIGVLEFADNAAAVTGGLPVGTHYRTGDLVKIVH